MVKDLFGSYGAGQDETVFKFASDVNVLAAQLDADARTSSNAGKVQSLAKAVRDLAAAS